METVKITIDGQEYEVEKGIPLVLAAERAGVRIPHLCYYEGTSVFAGCRVCVVQIEGARGLPTSCTTQTAEGQVVWTKTPEVVEMQRGVMSLILADHPDRCLSCHRQEHCGIDGVCLRDAVVTYRCLTCAKNKRCEFQSTSEELEMQKYPLQYYQEAHSWYGPEHVEQPVRRDNPFIELDFNECILCARCVRSCDEIRGLSVYELSYKGPEARIDTAFSLPMQDVGCDACGVCIDACPVACILDRPSKWGGNAQQTVTTVCPHCSDGCQIDVDVKFDRILRVSPNKAAEANHGVACARGRFGLEFVHDPDRLTTPLIRRNGQLVEVSWQEALEAVAAKLSQHKGNAFAALTSPQTTNEEHYLLQKLTRQVLGSPNINTYNPSNDPALQNALAQAFGYPASTNSLDEIGQTKCLFVLGNHTTVTHPIAAWQARRTARFTNGTLIVASPRDSELTHWADQWLRYNPGTEVALLIGMLRVIQEEGLADQTFLGERTQDLDALLRSIDSLTMETASQITGVPVADIQQAARTYAGAESSMVLCDETLGQFTENSEAPAAIVNLALLTGKIGKPASGVMAMGGGANLQGALDMGCTPAYAAGYQPLSGERGLNIADLVDAVGNSKVQAMLLLGVDPLGDDPQRDVFANAFQKLDFLVVADSFLTPTAQKADVVLPLTTFAELDGTFTNGERRVQRVRKVIPVVGQSLAGWQMVRDLAILMGANFPYPDASAVFDEITSNVDLYHGLNYDRLEVESPQWPCTSADSAGTQFLYESGFPGGKAHFLPFTYRPAAERTTGDYPLLLAVGRELVPLHKEILTIKEDPSTRPYDQELVRVHPDDASRLGVASGQNVRLVTRDASAEAMAHVTDEVPAGSVYLVLPLLHDAAPISEGPLAGLWNSYPASGLMAARLEKV